MNQANFLKKLEGLVTGDGFKRVREIPLQTFFLHSSGAPLTTTLTTNPGFDKFETNLTGLTWAAGKVVKAGLTFVVPDDYDETSDKLKLKLKALSAGSTDTPKLDAEAYIDDTPATDIDPTISAALSSSAAWVEIDFSGNSLAAGDILTIGIFPEAHGTDAVEVYGAKWEYASDLVFYDDTNRSFSD